MADPTPDALARKIFTITMLATIGYVIAVLVIL